MARGEQEGGLQGAGGVRNQATLDLTLGVSALAWREGARELQIVSLISSPPSRCETLDPRSRSRRDESERSAL